MKRFHYSTYRKLGGTLFIVPWITGFVLFMALPLLYSFYMSFHQVKITATGIHTTYKGLYYYNFILFENAGLLYDQLIPFLREALFMLPVIVVFSLLVAIMLNQKFWGRTFFRAVFFLPVIFTTGQVVTELIGQGQGNVDFLTSYHLSDLANTYLPASWAGPITNILDSFVLILWYSGVQILIFLAGRQTISPSVYEAARIDGANPWDTFWKITLPAMLPFVLLNFIYTTVDLFTFPSNPILTQVNIKDYGKSSALAWIYFAIIFLFLGLIYLLFNRLSRQSRVSDV
ncbi:sugar ABC transporter permease [Paenibacillus sp. BK720]|uniref:carbohydrate ABC transporter permease n=1 Tax=Paenibacillus sp. BK720 TaxID=2587092 RepID=UPI0014223E4E|nr:sugar ABC transporter permease [Paenibacillus sp. BK720]NIK67281.1 ABC-type sugar transport system permease subunit [Paenibacillus sp. BK720]